MSSNSKAVTLCSGQTRLDVEVQEVIVSDLPDDGDLRVAARVTTAAFSGRNDDVWLGAQSWRDFLVELHTLEARRSGEARIVSCSPSDLEIRVTVYDRPGHVRVTGHVGSDVVSVDGAVTATIPFRIEIDPSILPEIVAAFENLAASRD